VLETLSPPERLAFVLRDIFAMPFDEIAPIVDRSPEAARRLASGVRRRLQCENTIPHADLDTQREVLDAFIAAAREGDFEALLQVLDAGVVLRADLGPAGGSLEVSGAETVARQALFYSRLGLLVRPALVNVVAGLVSTCDGEPFSVLAVTVGGRKDRGDRHSRRPGTTSPARPHDPRDLNAVVCDAFDDRMPREASQRRRRSRCLNRHSQAGCVGRRRKKPRSCWRLLSYQYRTCCPFAAWSGASGANPGNTARLFAGKNKRRERRDSNPRPPA
jgi:hypothetical protein